MKSVIIVHPTDPVDRSALGAKISRDQPDSLVLVQCYDCESDGYWVIVFGELELLECLMGLCGQNTSYNPVLNRAAAPLCLSLNGKVEEIRQLLECDLINA